jgi:hypothetical protein
VSINGGSPTVTTKLRCLVLVTAMFVGAALGATGTATAGSNFGLDYILNSECCGSNNLTGTRSSIDAPGFNFGPQNQSGDIARVAAEYDGPNGAALLAQIGMAQTNNFNFDNCGGRSTLTNWWEYKPYSTSTMNYTCAWLSTIGTQGTTFKYSVKSPPSCASCWQLFLDGVLQKQVDLGLGVATQVYAGGELASCFTCTRPLQGLVEACYACAVGDTQWQRYNINDTYTTIGSSHIENDTGYWTITSDHSPFRLHHD